MADNARLGWKFLKMKDGRIVSAHDMSTEWRIGQVVHVEGGIRACGNGLHASEQILDALLYVKGEVLALVVSHGDTDASAGDKVASRNMIALKAVHWAKEDSVSLAVFCAEQVLGLFEAKNPGDDRPRKAIEAAKAWLADPSEENRQAARADAYAAYAADAYSADAHAAHAAAHAAAYAVHAAYAADAYSADAHAAHAAAYAVHAADAAAAVRRAGRGDLWRKIQEFLETRFDEKDGIQ